MLAELCLKFLLGKWARYVWTAIEACACCCLLFGATKIVTLLFPEQAAVIEKIIVIIFSVLLYAGILYLIFKIGGGITFKLEFISLSLSSLTILAGVIGIPYMILNFWKQEEIDTGVLLQNPNFIVYSVFVIVLLVFLLIAAEKAFTLIKQKAKLSFLSDTEDALLDAGSD